MNQNHLYQRRRRQIRKNARAMVKECIDRSLQKCSTPSDEQYTSRDSSSSFSRTYASSSMVDQPCKSDNACNARAKSDAHETSDCSESTDPTTTSFEFDDEEEWEAFLSQVNRESSGFEQADDTDSEVDEDVKLDISNDEETGKDIACELRLWAVSNNIPAASLSSLLSLLQKFHPSLPKDARTLLQTPRTVDVKVIGGGSYYHFGIVKSLEKLQEMKNLFLIAASHLDLPVIHLQVNIDGLPLFKSTTTQLWPILAKVSSPIKSDPFMIGLFCGDKKPVNVQEFLEDFVSEMKSLELSPVTLAFEESTFQAFVKLSCVICDAPARAYIKQVKGHSGYYSCEKCAQKGSWENTVIFPEVAAPLRTDVQFDEMKDHNHHTGVSPLSGLSIGLVSQFPLEYMHLLCLGVMKRILVYWSRSPVAKGFRLGLATINEISDRLKAFKHHIPREFSRKCRGLEELDRWKATEFRQFMLYSGIVALKGCLSKVLYEHFLLLFVAVHCLASPDLWRSHADYANELLCVFVTEAEHLYGRGFLVYNVHGLIHIAADVKKFGPLDSFSAFPFENFLGRLKKLVNKPQSPLQQIIRRVSEGKGLSSFKSKLPSNDVPLHEHRNGPVPKQINSCRQFKQIYFHNFLFSISQPDNCVKIRDRFYLIHNILIVDGSNEPLLVVERFIRERDFFSHPVKSSKLNILETEGTCGHITTFQITAVTGKYMCLPYKTRNILLPLLR